MRVRFDREGAPPLSLKQRHSRSSGGLALVLFAEGLGSFRQLLRFDVLFVRSYKPAIARRILYATAAVAVEHIRGLHDIAAAGLECLLVNAINVRNVDVEARYRRL